MVISPIKQLTQEYFVMQLDDGHAIHQTYPDSSAFHELGTRKATCRTQGHPALFASGISLGARASRPPRGPHVSQGTESSGETPALAVSHQSNSEHDIKYPHWVQTSLQCLDSSRFEHTGQNWTGRSWDAGAAFALHSAGSFTPLFTGDFLRGLPAPQSA